MRGMVINMNDEQLHTLADLQAFLTGTVAMNFTVTTDQRYEFIARTVRRFGYAKLKRADKAVVLRFLERVSGSPDWSNVAVSDANWSSAIKDLEPALRASTRALTCS